MEHHNLFHQSQIEQIIRRLQQIENKLDVLTNNISQTKPKPNPKTPWADNPQATEIDALIERADCLTNNEIEELNAYIMERKLSDVWLEALNVVDNSFRSGIWSEIEYMFPFPLTRVSDALLALVIRDLIDENTPWNQDAYDLLTGPWAKVIGTVHPDDVGV